MWKISKKKKIYFYLFIYLFFGKIVELSIKHVMA